MTKKQPDPAPATDEWGIYDPSKAGMQALYSRLGRPILRASEKSARRARRREGKSDRPADGVGLAIEEAKRRAGIMAAGPTAPPVPEPAVATAPAPAPVVTVAPVAPVAPAPPPPAAPVAKATRAVKAKAAKTSKRKLGAAVSAAGARLDAANGRRTAAVDRPTATPAPPPAPAPAPAAAASAAAPRRAARKTPKAKPSPAAAVVVTAPAVPSPSPRRPRGPVPLAAWAHAVSDKGPEPTRAEGKGLWRGIFRIPSEVALVEYARGCRIRRLVIEAASEPLDDPL